ncbi:hypothetical protein CEXT_372451 [Caerostris extrusa]|uniref:Uncharacterized protein n=1 Tax=Caerostris extrusa TaxID=172846 RepID=A0AAV4XVX1_CAEEX|nr:hypothetical protein CEXT_372451 [Caerostris extrusa]
MMGRTFHNDPTHQPKLSPQLCLISKYYIPLMKHAKYLSGLMHCHVKETFIQLESVHAAHLLPNSSGANGRYFLPFPSFQSIPWQSRHHYFVSSLTLIKTSNSAHSSRNSN